MSNQNKIISLRNLDRVGQRIIPNSNQTQGSKLSPEQLSISIEKQKSITTYIENGLEYVSSLPFVHKRDNNGNIVLVENETNNQKLLVEPNSITYTNQSVLNAIDTQFKYYLFPPNVIIQEPLDTSIELNIEQIQTDRFEGRILRSNRGLFYIQQNQARPFNLGAASSVWLIKQGLAPFVKIDSGMTLDSDPNNLLADYDVGENLYPFYHNKSYEQVSTLILDSYSTGEPFLANEALPSSRIYQIRVHLYFNEANDLFNEVVQSNARFSFDASGADVVESTGIEYRARLETLSRLRSEGNNTYVVRDLFIDANNYEAEQIIPLRVENLVVTSTARNVEVEAPQIVQDLYSLVSRIWRGFNGENVVERFLDFYDNVFDKIESLSQIASRLNIPVPDLTSAVDKVQNFINEGRPSGILGAAIRSIMNAALNLIGRSLGEVEEFIERINNFDLLETLAGELGESADGARARIEEARTAAQNWLVNQFNFVYPELQYDVEIGSTDLTYVTRALEFNATDRDRSEELSFSNGVMVKIPLDTLLDILQQKASTKFGEDGLPLNGVSFADENTRINIYIKKTSA